MLLLALYLQHTCSRARSLSPLEYPGLGHAPLYATTNGVSFRDGSIARINAGQLRICQALVLTLSLDVQHVKPSDPFVSKILQLWSSEHGGRHACKGVVTVFFAGEVQLMLTGKHLNFPEQGLLELHALSPVVVVLDPSDWLSLESESPPVVSLLVAVAEAVMSENGMNRLVEFATGGSFEAVPFPVLE